MTPEQSNFFRQLLHTAIQGLLYRTLWGVPWGVAVILLLVLIGVVVYLGLY
jgi:hypothetical protein